MNTSSGFLGAGKLRCVLAITSGVLLVGGATYICAAETLIPLGASWRYRDLGVNQGSAWRETNYNDSAWAFGPSQLGCCEGDEMTTINIGPTGARYPTTYFRHTFVVTNRAALTNVAVRLMRDDGGIVYLNGIEVFRSNMPDGPVTYSTLAAANVGGSDESAFFGGPIPPGLLLSETNVIAVEIHQDLPTSSDLSFSLELLANTPLGNLPPVAALNISASGMILDTNETVTINVAAFDDAAISRIDVLQNGATIRTFFTNAAAFTLSNLATGIQDFTARAVDSAGASSFSDTARVLITPPGFQAQSVFFPQFPSSTGLVLQVNAHTASNILHLMQPAGTGRGGAWMDAPQGVLDGFICEFSFRITNQHAGGADGFAFVIAGTPQPVFGGSDIGYSGITNSLAVEFDTWYNTDDGDNSDHHISVHTQGTLGNSENESASIGRYTPATDFASDGAVHRVKILYTPGSFQVFLDNPNSPVLNLNVNLGTLLSLPNGNAWIGFTAGSGGSWESHDILAWSHSSLANIPPVVRLISPAQAVRVAPGAGLTLTVDASDPNGTVTAVGFSVDGKFLDEIGEMPPFSLVWSNLAPGIHVLRGGAEDNDGTLALSRPVVLEVVPTAAAVTLFSDFSSASNLVLQGSAALLTNRLRLTPAASSQTGGAWLNSKQRVADGFETVFQFQVSQLSNKGADGLAFIIFGSEVPLLGDAGFGLGYRSLTNSLAVEFDTYQNSETSDLDGNHIGIHSLGLLPNSTDESASLARVKPLSDMSDGAVHTVIIRYDGAKLSVYLDDLPLPVLEHAVNVSSLLSLDNGTAWVGFTSATGGEFENHDILMWSFRPNLPPSIQLTAPDGGPFFAGTNLIVSADAGDVDGDLSGVQFFANENLIGAASTAPFSISWSNASAGTYSLKAIAFDDLGARTVSLPLTVSLIELRLQHHVRQTDGSTSLDFMALTGGTYTVQYSADLVNWSNAVPSINGTGGVVQWRDTGPPVTVSPPATAAQRFYRLVLSP